jgi:hypothetical protein
MVIAASCAKPLPERSVDRLENLALPLYLIATLTGESRRARGMRGAHRLRTMGTPIRLAVFDYADFLAAGPAPTPSP